MDALLLLFSFSKFPGIYEKSLKFQPPLVCPKYFLLNNLMKGNGCTFFIQGSFSSSSSAWGVIHKPRGQLMGGGLAKWQFYYISKPYLLKVTTKGEGPQKYPKYWPRGLWMTPGGISLHPNRSKRNWISWYLIIKWPCSSIQQHDFAIKL